MFGLNWKGSRGTWTGERMTNADDAEVSFRQSLNSERTTVLSDVYTESIQLTASVLSESTNWIAQLLTWLRSEFDINFVSAHE